MNMETTLTGVEDDFLVQKGYLDILVFFQVPCEFLGRVHAPV